MTRIEEMITMRNNGESLKAVGDHFGITRERVRQLLKREGYVGKPDIAQQRLSPEQKEDKRKRKIAWITAWQKRNPEKVKQYRKGYKKRRSARDPGYRVHQNLQRRIQGVLKGDRKADSSVDLIGCTPDQLRAHLEAQFEPGMTWDNYGVFGWHVDHIVSCWRFDRSDPDWQRKCFHYTNLQPLWREDNMTKRDHWGQV